jgi:hypothetical protein
MSHLLHSMTPTAARPKNWSRELLFARVCGGFQAKYPDSGTRIPKN